MKFVYYLLLVCAIGTPALASDNLYVVRENDTLASVLRAQNYGESYAELLPFINETVKLNATLFANGDVNYLRPGSTITLPDNPSQPEPEPEPVPQPVAEPEPEPIPELEPEPVVPTIGSIEVSGGRTEISRNGETIEVRQSGDLYARDVVLTQENSIAEIILIDDTRISVGPNSEFSINEFSFTAPASQGEDAIGMLLASISNGVIRTITGLIGKARQNTFAIKSTLNATIGIRGTDFTLRSCNDINRCGDLYGVAVAVLGGSISFKNDAAEIALDKDEFAQVQSTTEAPQKKPLPEGFFDLRRDVAEIEIPKSWWQESIDYLKSLF